MFLAKRGSAPQQGENAVSVSRVVRAQRRDNMAKIIDVGKRLHETDKFYFFYTPLLKENRKENFWFFWWMGRRWYVCCPKKKAK
jgi:hypothetical protein